MLEKLWVKNYRSLANVEVYFGDITVLVGLNGSGKSNLIDVLRFVSDALLLGLDTAVFKRMGMSALRRWSADYEEYDVEIGLSLRTQELSAQYEFVLGSRNKTKGLAGYCVKRESCIVDKGGQKSEFSTENGQWLKKPAGIYPQIHDHLLLLPIIGGIEPYKEIADFIKGMSFYNFYPNLLRMRQKFVNPYPLDSEGQNLASSLFELGRINSQQAIKLKSALNFVLFEIDNYQITQAGGDFVVKLHHDITADGQGAWFDFNQESDGTLRMLAILMALYQEPPRTLIGLEEPELTVHSGTIVKLWQEIEDFSERSQILLTTHSPDLLDLCTVDQLRVVEKVDGITYVGFLDETQKDIIQNKLFVPSELLRSRGELHRATVN